MRAGLLRNRVTIQTPTETDDGQGGITVVWSGVLDTYAEIQPLTSRERLQTGQLDGGVTHKVTMRYNPTVNAKSRILFGARILYPIGSPINLDERNREITLTCEERKN